ncbi:hypothetical protein LguiB_017913 [Lonicera macranthoides]
MKKFTMLPNLLSCSTGSIAQDLWFLSRLDEKSKIASYKHAENDFDLVHGLDQPHFIAFTELECPSAEVDGSGSPPCSC